MRRLRILTLYVMTIIGFLSFSDYVNAHWTSTLGGAIATLSGGAKCDSLLSQASCRESICKNEGVGDCKKNFCKTNAEIIKYHLPCACAAGLATKNCPQSSDQNDPVVRTNRKCRSLWAKAQRKPIDCGFCEKYRDECTNIEGLFDWCTENCPDDSNEEDD